MESPLPRILIIDDELGALPERRAAFCKAVGLLEAKHKRATETQGYLAEAVFESGQTEQNGAKQNDIGRVKAAIKAGWPFKDGTRWALVCLDLHFSTGLPGHEKAEFFGATIVSEICRDWPSKQKTEAARGTDLPIIMLSTRPNEQVNRMVSGRAVPCLDKWSEEGDAYARDEMAKILFTDGLVPDGWLRMPNASKTISPIDRPVEERLQGHSVALLDALRQARVLLKAEAYPNILVTGPAGYEKTLLTRYLNNHLPAAHLAFHHKDTQAHKPPKVIGPTAPQLSSSYIDIKTVVLEHFQERSAKQITDLREVLAKPKDYMIAALMDPRLDAESPSDLPQEIAARFVRLAWPSLPERKGDASQIFEQHLRALARGPALESIDDKASAYINANVRDVLLLEPLVKQVVARHSNRMSVSEDMIKEALSLFTIATTPAPEHVSLEELITILARVTVGQAEVRGSWPRFREALGAVIQEIFSAAAAESIRNTNAKRSVNFVKFLEVLGVDARKGSETKDAWKFVSGLAEVFALDGEIVALARRNGNKHEGQ